MRVYNPTFEQHGWQSPHTAIDIVSDDMPFLVDSVSMELSRREAGIHVLVHPVIGDESYMHIEIDRQAGGLEELADALRHVLDQVRAAVEDWQPMKARLQELLDEPAPAGVDPAEVEEAKALLAWVGDHHFTFLGYREYTLDGEALRADEGTGLGLLRGGAGHVSTAFAKLPPAVRAFALEPHLLVLTKANNRSPVHRPSLPGLRRRQALRRRRQRRRRAPLPRALHRRSPTARCRRRSRCCAAPSRRCSSAPGSRPAATTTRRSTRSSTRSRATSSSR